MAIGVLAFACTYMVFEALAPTPRASEASRTTVVLIDVVLAACTVLQLRLPYAAGVCGVLFGAYCALSLTIFHLPNSGWNLLALLTACVLGCLASGFMEQSARSDFLLRRKLELLADSRLQAVRATEHEIRNKLVAIGGPIRLAERWIGRGLGADRIRPHLNNALDSLKELDRMLHMMLNVARMEAGYEPVLEQTEVVSVDSVVREVCEEKSAELSAIRGADEHSSTPQALPEVIFEAGDGIAPSELWPYSLRLVLQNVLENAVKYSPAGGVIRVRAWAVEGELRVSVADQGIGIDTARLDGLFASLYKRGDAGANSVTGMGVGLDVVKRLMDAQAGRIWAESPGPGCGSTFFLALPLKRR
jgi:signal transduction histidine kinase